MKSAISTAMTFYGESNELSDDHQIWKRIIELVPTLMVKLSKDNKIRLIYIFLS